MNELKLIPHPNFYSVAVRGVRVTATRRAQSAFKIEYRLVGDLDQIELPVAELPKRRDELWRTTCFEMFIRAAGQEHYQEFNFSPSAGWAAYEFRGHRTGMKNAMVGRAPVIAAIRYPKVLIVDVYIDTVALDRAVQANFTAVIEARDGSKSYWALAHAPGPPDFHNPDCFVATLPAPRD